MSVIIAFAIRTFLRHELRS
ncbi:hypothetical protein [Tenacibaculum litopenaei]